MKKIIIALIVIIVISIIAIISLILMNNVSSVSDKDFSYLNKPYVINNNVKKLNEVENLYFIDRLITNLSSNSHRRFIKIDIYLELENSDIKDLLNDKKQVLKSKIITILNTSNVERLLNLKGKDKLKEEIVNNLNYLFQKNMIKDIYFSEFVIQ